MLDPEVYIDAGIATLRAGLSQSIDAENLLHADFAIPKPVDQNGAYDPSRILFGGEDDTDTILGYPAVVFAIPDVARTDMSLGIADWDVSPTAIVQAFIEQTADIATQPQLYRAIIRYARVVNRVMLVPDSFGPGVTITAAREAHRINAANPAVQGNQRTAFCLLTYTLEGAETPG